MSDQQDDQSTGFEDFEDFMQHFKVVRSATSIPDSFAPMVFLESEKRAVWLQLDKDHRLVLDPASRVYDNKLPIVVPAACGIIEAAPVDGNKRLIIGIDILNYTNDACTCWLWQSEEAPVDARGMFGIVGGTILPYSVWSWRGRFELDATWNVWGQAGAANKLRAFFSVQYGPRFVREP